MYPAKQYTIVDGVIVPFADILDSNPDLRTTVMDPNDFTRVRFVVILQNSEGEPRRLRLRQWNDLGVEKWRNIPKNESIELQAGWLDVVKYSIDTMSPRDIEKSFGMNRSSQS
ncbi:hypothetical protein C0995_004177 [Termitomyces sp. Mi166|nr:hypothetical protein C0995_004177 [Termitomyces sp. Mi166\